MPQNGTVMSSVLKLLQAGVNRFNLFLRIVIKYWDFLIFIV